MCGIWGYWSDDQPSCKDILNQMGKRIEHRGPDSSGFWCDSASGVALGHRRLAIIDLSAAGHQPMLSTSERFILSYNGEVYNFDDLKTELASEVGGMSWRGNSDTEVLLAAIENWGLSKTLSKLNGMFAFALWDQKEQSLTLARDRMGEKPLYYGWVGTTLLFGSELTAFAPFPEFNPQINRNALSAYLRHGYVPTPHCIYEGFYKLAPAHLISFSRGDGRVNEPKCYWNLPNIASNAQKIELSDKEAGDELDRLINRSIARQMVADVPVGSFLSGGFDSSLVSAVMQTHSDKPIKTFTIGFQEEGYNEAEHAKAVAKHIGSDHVEHYVTGDEAIDVVELLPEIWSEPFADSSQIPTYLVSRLARQDVTVSLSGDGGDELFYGYARYEIGRKIWTKLSRTPKPLRKLANVGLSGLSGQLATKLMPYVLGQRRSLRAVDRMSRVSEMLLQSDQIDFYKNLVSHLNQPDDMVLSANEAESFFANKDIINSLGTSEEQMMLIDSMTYLPDDILTKVDRAGMAMSLEGRIPLLDHSIVEFAATIPQNMKQRKGDTKWLLRQVLYKYVPKSLLDRPKMGFGIPLEHWLRGPLKDWAEALLSPKRLDEDGFFDTHAVRKMWREHQLGLRRWHPQLWDILMFQAWYHNPKRLEKV